MLIEPESGAKSGDTFNGDGLPSPVRSDYSKNLSFPYRERNAVNRNKISVFLTRCWTLITSSDRKSSNDPIASGRLNSIISTTHAKRLPLKEAAQLSLQSRHSSRRPLLQLWHSHSQMQVKRLRWLPREVMGGSITGYRRAPRRHSHARVLT